MTVIVYNDSFSGLKMTTSAAFGSKIDHNVRSLYVQKGVNCLRSEDELSICSEIRERKAEKPNWNHDRKCPKSEKNQLDNSKDCTCNHGTARPKPGSYRAVLNRRKKKTVGCLILETKSEKDPDKWKHAGVGADGNFYLIAATNGEPILQYSKACNLCKSSDIWVKKSKNIHRQDLKLDRRWEQLGNMISRKDVTVHQMCLDYAHGPNVVQNYEEEPGVEKLDGYPMDVIRNIRGSKCFYCHKSKAVTACAESKCKSKC